PRASRLAWVLFGATLACLAVAVWLGVLTRDVQGTDWGSSGIGAAILVGAALVAFPVVGVLVATRQPRNAIGWIMIEIGLVFFLSAAMDSYAVFAILLRPGWPGGAVVASLSQWTWVPVFAMAVTFLLLLFPDGHLLSPRWRW